jgi:hypothetical protein
MSEPDIISTDPEPYNRVMVQPSEVVITNTIGSFAITYSTMTLLGNIEIRVDLYSTTNSNYIETRFVSITKNEYNSVNTASELQSLVATKLGLNKQS